MAHHNTIKANNYHKLAERLNKFPQGAILKLPPAKQLLASQQFRSRYLLALIRKFS